MFAVAIAGSTAWACSSAPSPGSHGSAGGAGGNTDSQHAGADSNSNSGETASGSPNRGDAGPDGEGGLSPGNASFGGKSAGNTAASGASSGGASSATAGSNSANAGTNSSTASEVRRVYYLDVQGSVRTFDEDKPTARTLVKSAGQGPDGIAVDAASGHIYWTTMGVPAADDGSLRRAELDGSKVTTIVPEGGSYTPKQLRLDSANKRLYWSDREGMRIQSANIDGSGLETLVTVATGDSARKNAQNWCVGLALDVAQGFIYWTQKGPDNGMVGSIRRAHLLIPDGETDTTRTDIEVLIDKLPEPVDLDLDVSAGQMYWTDRGDDTINRAPMEIPSGKTAATRTDREILVRGVREAIGVTLDLERGHVYYTSGASGRVGRANLDGSGAVDLVTGSGALTGIAVVPAGR